MKLHLWPEFSGEDQGDGGIRRVVEAQRQSLPRLGIEFVEDPSEADVIACHATVPDEYARRFPDKPIINHTHGLYWKEYKWLDWSYKANREVLKAICTADVTTAPTEWVAQVVRRHTSRDVRVIPHGISGRDWQPPAAHRGYVLWNKTRIDPVCEVNSLNALARALPEVPFVSTFGKEASNMQLTGRLSFKKAKELIRHAGVYLCTTRETFGIGTLEAMACGVPVVGFNFGGQAEFIEHGVDGYLAEPGDIEDLAEGVKWALEHRSEISEPARKKAVSFSWTNAMTKYRDLYVEFLTAYERQDQQPRVSIIVPAYNLEQYLPDTLTSVLQQADPDWECIIVDDASPDRCGQIADEYAIKDSRFKVIHNEQNLYLAGARNVGISQAKGRYVLPIDADDMLTPHATRILADALDADRSLQVAYGNVLFTGEDGRTPVDYHVSSQTVGHSGWPMAFDPWQQARGANLLPYSSMFRKTAWEQVGGYRTRLKTSEDADFWTRLTSYGYRAKMVAQADTLVYRNRDNSMSRTNEDKRYEYMKWYPWARSQELAPAGLSGDENVGLYTPHVAVIIPVGPGHEALVQDAVDSVAAQTYQLWECIVVNDSGHSLNLPTWVKVLETDARDTASARNLGIAAASGRLFLPLDADDFLQPEALEMLIAAHIESEGEVIYPDFFEDPEQEGEFKPYQLDDYSCESLTQKGSLHGVTALTPIAVWKAVGGYKEGSGWEDWDFQLRCAEKGVCTRRLAVPLFTYRKWTGMRRDFDQNEFARRKAAMLEDWKPYFTGEKQFMSCSCNGRTVNGSKAQAQVQTMRFDGASSPDAVRVEYVGRKMGSVRYRGQGTGNIYTFAAGEGPRWVAAADVTVFANHSEFRVITGEPQKSDQEPALSI